MSIEYPRRGDITIGGETPYLYDGEEWLIFQINFPSFLQGSENGAKYHKENTTYICNIGEVLNKVIWEMYK